MANVPTSHKRGSRAIHLGSEEGIKLRGALGEGFIEKVQLCQAARSKGSLLPSSSELSSPSVLRGLGNSWTFLCLPLSDLNSVYVVLIIG